ncbi:MAG TPA: FtsX-like permease family protein [Trebonia sp.]|nr:FtsX-like permease family protein [Trebonia sp.]
MLRFALAQLRFRPGRSAALLAVLVATVACFALVGTSARSEQVAVHGRLEADSRAAYDLLARPAGSVSTTERRGDLVSSTAMSSVDGGITLKQWHEIEQIPGVYAAAPVAVVGYDYVEFDVAVHVPAPAPGQSQVLYRLAPQFDSENGLTKIPAEDQYVYTTTSPLAAPLNQPDPQVPAGDGTTRPICQGDDGPNNATSEIIPACGSTNRQDAWNAPSAANPHATGVNQQLPTGTQVIPWFFPFLVEAIDPAQEARLVGLDHAVTSGSYLSESAGPVSYAVAKPDAQTRKIGPCQGVFSLDPIPGTRCQWTSVPMLAANASPMQETLQITVYRMPQSAAASIGRGALGINLGTTLPALAPAARTGSVTVTAQQIYSQLLAQLAGQGLTISSEANLLTQGANDFRIMLTASPIRYASHGAAQVPRIVRPGQVLSDSDMLAPWTTVPLNDVYPDLTDTAVRTLVEHDTPNATSVTLPPNVTNINGWINEPELNLVGTFDPAKVSDGSSALSAVPMQTYFADTATGADPASARALGGEPLRPNGNTAGLLSVSPSLLTTISSLPELESSVTFEHADAADGINAAAPISVIRVKLAGRIGLDPASQARLRLVALEIYQRTGLHVDITEGSSPAPVTVADPAGHYGRPALQLTEMWSRVGASELISAAIDQKTRLLLGLVLVLGAVFTASAVAASVRARRPELAVLACVGWPRRSLAGLILTECALLGIAAGIGGAALAAALAPLAGTRLSAAADLALAAAALALTCLAGLYPALLAARAHPGAATAQVPGRRRRALRAPTLARLAAVNVARAPGRSLLAAGGVALAAAGVTLLTVLTLAFHGSAAGTVLGQAVVVQVHTADYAAAAVCAALGLALAADISYTATRDRAGEHALLRATGWASADLTRLGAGETAITATAGAAAGCALPVLGVWAATGAAPPGAIAAAAGIGGAAVALTLLAALVPARRLMRTPPARDLAEA